MTDLWEPVSGVFWSTAPLLPSMGFSSNYGELLTSIIGALAGAGVGAWAAGHISEKNKIRDQLTKEIRDTNAAIILALGVMNTGIGLKRQHIKPLQDHYNKQRETCRKMLEQINKGHPQTEFPQLNLLQLHEISPPISHLQEIVLSRLSTTGRSLATATELSDAVCNLNMMLKLRNNLLIRLQNGELPAGARREHLYFGLSYGKGETNEEYRDSVDGTSKYTDDVIFFGSELCSDLLEHGNILAQRFKKRLGGSLPEVLTVDLSRAREEGWIPDAEEYTEWTSGFRKKQIPVKKHGFLFWKNLNL